MTFHNENVLSIDFPAAYVADSDMAGMLVPSNS